jgi:hypothetical protein
VVSMEAVSTEVGAVAAGAAAGGVGADRLWGLASALASLVPPLGGQAGVLGGDGVARGGATPPGAAAPSGVVSGRVGDGVLCL